MIEFNLSVDFEMGWGDLERLTRDDEFCHRVVAGLNQCQAVLDVLERAAIPSIWGVVGACCFERVDELAAASPQAFGAVGHSLNALVRRRPSHTELLFCRETVLTIARSDRVELGSHGFMHLVPIGCPLETLQEDVTASTTVLRRVTGQTITSFIPPQNYHWPDDAFRRAGIRRVRHTPTVIGVSYSDPRRRAKIARLWNDFVRPASYGDAAYGNSHLVFLRMDRGNAAWAMQLTLLRRLLASGDRTIACYVHPHNLYSSTHVRRFAELCDVVAERRARSALKFGGFLRVIQ